VTRRIRICLAGSSGGHFRQLLDLKPFWEQHDTHFVTEPTALARKLSQSHRVYQVPHYAFGQVRSRSPASVAGAALRNMRASWRAIAKERPQLIISTGAGSTAFAVLFAKLRGAKFVFIETFARFEAPSLFGRMMRPLADAVFVQSEGLLKAWPDAEVFDPLHRLGPAVGEKEDLGLVTVGTILPFDRLVKAVAALGKESGRPSTIVAQVGEGGFVPEGMEVHEAIEFDRMSNLLERANVVFCHGGTGSLITALQRGCRVVAMPRRQDLGEHYNDHQQEIVSAFAARGLIEVAEEASDLESALERALAKPAQRATTDATALIERLRELTDEWSPRDEASLQ
jgi:UDP-N-acetylglucosamine transferase subunit ALG13